MKPALQHHYALNDHHPEHKVEGVDGMSLFSLLDMVCDWVAASERHAHGDVWRSLDLNRDRFGLDPQLMSILTNTLRELGS